MQQNGCGWVGISRSHRLKKNNNKQDKTTKKKRTWHECTCFQVASNLVAAIKTVWLTLKWLSQSKMPGLDYLGRLFIYLNFFVGPFMIDNAWYPNPLLWSETHSRGPNKNIKRWVIELANTTKHFYKPAKFGEVCRMWGKAIKIEIYFYEWWRNVIAGFRMDSGGVDRK